MITALRKNAGVCFECPDFKISHYENKYWQEIMELAGSVTESEALEMVNNYLAAQIEQEIEF